MDCLLRQRPLQSPLGFTFVLHRLLSFSTPIIIFLVGLVQILPVDSLPPFYYIFDLRVLNTLLTPALLVKDIRRAIFAVGYHLNKRDIIGIFLLWFPLFSYYIIRIGKILCVALFNIFLIH